MELDEILAFRREPVGDRIVLIKLEDCLPCDLLAQAVPLLPELTGYDLAEFLVTFADKKAMGAVLKAGISDFPLFEMYQDGNRVLRHTAVRGGTVDEVTAHLSQSLKAAGLAPRDHAA